MWQGNDQGSAGCGGIMRVLPCVLLPLGLRETMIMGAWQAALTHDHLWGFWSAGFFAGLLWCGLNAMSLEKAYEECLAQLKTLPQSEKLWCYLEEVDALNVKFRGGQEAVKHFGAGWTGHSALGVALWGANQAQDWQECLVLAVNHEGDSDSKGLLAGQLFAAFNEVKEQELAPWIERLDVVEVVRRHCFGKAEPS